MHPKLSLQAPLAHDQPPFPPNAKHNGPCPPKTAYNQHSPNMGQNLANMPAYNQHLANLRPNPADLPPSYRPPRQVRPGYAHDKLNIGPQYVNTDPLSPHKTPTWPPSRPNRRQHGPQVDPTGANMGPTRAPNRPLRRPHTPISHFVRKYNFSQTPTGWLP